MLVLIAPCSIGVPPVEGDLEGETRYCAGDSFELFQFFQKQKREVLFAEFLRWRFQRDNFTWKRDLSGLFRRLPNVKYQGVPKKVVGQRFDRRIVKRERRWKRQTQASFYLSLQFHCHQGIHPHIEKPLLQIDLARGIESEHVAGKRAEMRNQ